MPMLSRKQGEVFGAQLVQPKHKSRILDIPGLSRMRSENNGAFPHLRKPLSWCAYPRESPAQEAEGSGSQSSSHAQPMLPVFQSHSRPLWVNPDLALSSLARTV